MNHAPLAYWLHAFFHEWLAEQRNCSRHTVLSYRDTWRLYLRFVAGRRRHPVSALTLAELTADEVLAFLKHVESERRTSIGTRNCRLAAIRSFYRFVMDREPLAAMQCAAILRIPIKKGPRNEPDYLDSEEVTEILKQPKIGLRIITRNELVESDEPAIKRHEPGSVAGMNEARRRKVGPRETEQKIDVQPRHRRLAPWWRQLDDKHANVRGYPERADRKSTRLNSSHSS